MTTINPETRSRLEKILALSNRGVDGERTAAKAKLSELLKKHGLDEADFLADNEPPILRVFRYKTTRDCQMLRQIVARHYQERERSWGAKGERNTIYFYLTNLEFLDVTELWAFYKAEFARELGIFWRAFVQANDLGRKVATSAPPTHLTEEEKRVLAMAASIEKKNRMKQIGK